MRNNLDAGENLNKKEKIHDLDDEQSSIPPDFCYTCSLVKPCVDMSKFSSIHKICWVPSIKIDQQLTTNCSTKESKNGGPRKTKKKPMLEDIHFPGTVIVKLKYKLKYIQYTYQRKK
jgi:hypothetical protein